jgi:hypothetical protein
VLGLKSPPLGGVPLRASALLHGRGRATVDDCRDAGVLTFASSVGGSPRPAGRFSKFGGDLRFSKFGGAAFSRHRPEAVPKCPAGPIFF